MDAELPRLIDEARAVAAEVETSFGKLSVEQLNWKPSDSEWSVAQCFEHLIASNAGYIPLVQKIVRNEHRTSIKERLPLLPRFFGPMVLRVVQPQSKRKFKAGPRFEPSRSEIGSDVIPRFQRQQQEMIDNMNLTKDVNLRKTIITSPVASFVTYSLLDAFKIVVAHEQRHFLQAKRVTERQGFPSSA